MINILLDLVNEKDFNSRIVKKIREELPDARISLILGTPEELPEEGSLLRSGLRLSNTQKKSQAIFLYFLRNDPQTVQNIELLHRAP